MIRSRLQDTYEWFPFYPEDWLSDNGLAACSDATKGVWIDMLCRMWKSPTRGAISGDLIVLSRIMGRNEKAMKRALDELVQFRVCEVSNGADDGLPCGSIVNRRMYREWKLKRARSDAGREGGRISKRKAKPEKT